MLDCGNPVVVRGRARLRGSRPLVLVDDSSTYLVSVASLKPCKPESGGCGPSANSRPAAS